MFVRIFLTNRKQFAVAEDSGVVNARIAWERIRRGFPFLVDEAWYDIETSQLVSSPPVMTLFNPDLVERITEE